MSASGSGGQPARGAGVVERGGQVGRGVGEGAVQVEQDGFNHDGRQSCNSRPVSLPNEYTLESGL